jgi:Ca2+-binding RTX toxin-like protein
LPLRALTPIGTELWGPLLANPENSYEELSSIVELLDSSAVIGSFESPFGVQGEVGMTTTANLKLPFSSAAGSHDGSFAGPALSADVVQGEVWAGTTRADTHYGSEGADTLDGLQGADVLLGKGGSDVLQGGDGNDALYGGDNRDRLSGGAGKDSLYGEMGSDRLFGGEENDKIAGGQGDDYLSGGSGSDRIFGGDGNDAIQGGDGWDRVYGGAGDDIISGGIGADRLYGGPGSDVFVINSPKEVFKSYYISETYTFVVDRIMDFTPGEDKIDLRNLDANPLTAEHDAFVYSLSDDGYIEQGPGHVAWFSGMTAKESIVLINITQIGQTDSLEFFLVDSPALTRDDFIL